MVEFRVPFPPRVTLNTLVTLEIREELNNPELSRASGNYVKTTDFDARIHLNRDD